MGGLLRIYCEFLSKCDEMTKVDLIDIVRAFFGF